MGRHPTGAFSVEQHFSPQTVERLNREMNLQHLILNLNESSYENDLESILKSVYIKKEDLHSLVDYVVTSTYINPQKFSLYCQLLDDLQKYSDPKNNHLANVVKKTCKFIFKSILPCQSKPDILKPHSCAFILFLRTLYLRNLVELSDIYAQSSKNKILFKYMRYFFPEFGSLDGAPLLSDITDDTTDPQYLRDMYEYYTKYKEYWDELLEKYALENSIESAIMTDDIDKFNSRLELKTFDPTGYISPLLLHPVASEFGQLNYLSFACLFNAVNIVKLLLNLNIKPETNDFLTLHCAIRGGGLELMEILNPLELNFKTPNLDCCAKFAARYFNEVLLEYIFQTKVLPSQHKSIANICLEYCGESGNFRALKDLLDKRAQISYNSLKRDILIAACECGHRTLVEIILESPSIVIDLQDVLKRTPIFTACEYNFHQIVKLLVNKNADAAKVALLRKTPAWIAACNGNVKCLMELGNSRSADFNTWEIKDKLMSPLFVAIDGGHVECVKFLLTVPGIDLRRKTTSGVTSMFAALTATNQENSAKIVEVLLQGDPNIDLKSRYKKMTPLMYALDTGRFDIVDLISTPKSIKFSPSDQVIISNYLIDLLDSFEPVEKFTNVLIELYNRKISYKSLLDKPLVYRRRTPNDDGSHIVSLLSPVFVVSYNENESELTISEKN